MPVRTLSDIAELEKVPLAERQLAPSTYGALNAQAEKTPERKALSFFLEADQFEQVHEWSYRQLFAEITRAANAFTYLGLKQDQVVAFILPNLPETHFTIWGGEAAGIAMPINPLLEAAQIGDLLRSARAKIVVTLAPTPGTEMWQKLASQLDTLPDVKSVLWVDLVPYLPKLEGDALRMMAGRERLRHSQRQIVDLKTVMEGQPTNTLISGRVIQPHERSSYFCTGGTTRLPKIACRAHGSEVFDAWAIGLTLGPRDRRTFFCGLPLFHVNGQLVTGLLPWTRGDHVVLGTPQGYRGNGALQHFWQIVEKFKINFFSGVPTVYASLLQQPIGSSDISSLEYGLCGASPMPAELFRNFESKTGVRILEGYGLTEGACVSSINPPGGERRIGSIGLRLPYQAMLAVVLDQDGRYIREARIGEIGTIVIRGPNVFHGYLNDEDDRSIWIEIDGKKWLNTGDLGREDTEGYFWLTGRSKELIIRGGHNIDPMQIEEPLLRHPDVQMAAAVARPDAYYGELPVAYVQLRTGASASEEAMLEYAKSTIGERAAWPKVIRFIDQMPQTAVGKLFKPALRRMEIRDALLSALNDAGLGDSRLDLVEDAQSGLRVNVCVSTEENKEKAEAVLARYPFAFAVLLADATLSSNTPKHVS
ncbi:MAG: acyl-CoA synthetase [Terriglobales bacterium]